MHPILTAVRLPGLDWVVQIHAYPLAHVLALLVLVAFTYRRYARAVGPPGPALDALVAGVIAGMLGARLLADWTSGHAPANPLPAPRGWWLGARSAYGGLLAGTAIAALVARLRAVPVGRLFDAAAPALALAVCLARLGCFLGGCCWGRPTTSWLGMRFPSDHPAMAAHPAGLHPTQLYLALGALAIALLLLASERTGRMAPGTRFRLGAGLYALGVFGVEFLRADPGRWFGAGLSHSQWISLGVLLAVLWPRRAARPAALLVVALLVPTVAYPGTERSAWRSDAEQAAFGRLADGAVALLDGDLPGALAHWQAETADAASPSRAEAHLALGFGHLLEGDRARALTAFEQALTDAAGETAALAHLAAGRVQADDGDRVGAAAHFRRLLTEHADSTLADDAALGLAYVLSDAGLHADARAVLADAARRFERRARYVAAGRGPRLRWEQLGRLPPQRLANVLRRRLARPDQGVRALASVPYLLIDRDTSRDLRRLRRRLSRAGAGGAADEVGARRVPGTTTHTPRSAGLEDPPTRWRPPLPRTASQSRGTHLAVAGLAIVALAAGRTRRRYVPSRTPGVSPIARATSTADALPIPFRARAQRTAPPTTATASPSPSIASTVPGTWPLPPSTRRDS